MDSVIAEMCRARYPIQERVFRRWCAHLRDVVQPQLDAARASSTPTPEPDAPTPTRRRTKATA